MLWSLCKSYLSFQNDTEVTLEGRIKETPEGESTAGPRRRLLIQALIVSASLHICKDFLYRPDLLRTKLCI